MKKYIAKSVVVILATLLCIGITACGKTAQKELNQENWVALETLMQANGADAIFGNYESLTVSQTVKQGFAGVGYRGSLTAYIDREFIFLEYAGGREKGYLKENYAAYVKNGETYSALVTEQGAAQTFMDGIYQEPVLDPGSVQKETVIKQVEKDGLLYITTELSPEQAWQTYEDGGVEQFHDKTEHMNVLYVCDAQSYQLRSIRSYVVKKDGAKVPYLEIQVAFGGEPSDGAKAMYNRLQEKENVSTVTVVCNPNTPEEQEITAKVVKGDALVFELPGDGVYYTDRTCTQEAEQINTENDLTLFCKTNTGEQE